MKSLLRTSPVKETIFCKRDHSAKETYNVKEPTNRSPPIAWPFVRENTLQHIATHCNTLQHVSETL